MQATPDQRPRIGVVIAAFNAGPYLAATLESVAAQNYAAWECVVVDDGSTDDTAAIADGFAAADNRFRLLRQANAGLSNARNAGLDAVAADTEWLAIIDSDDTWLPDALETLVTAAVGRPDAVGVYGLAEYMDEQGTPMQPGFHPQVQRDRRRPGRFDLVDLPVDSDHTFESLIVSGTIWPPAVGLFRRSVVERAGRFDPEQHSCEDWDLYLRMSRYGPFAPLDRQVAWYRQHGNNMISKQLTMTYYHARTRWKASRALTNTRRQRVVAGKVWRRLQARHVVWSFESLLHAAARRDRRATSRAARATAVFLGELLRGRPGEPSERTARYVVDFVVPRRGPAVGTPEARAR